ncbi:MAG: type II secretion system GspH family protein [Candidatus Omnitrophica bacterium]|nr:type II secretion system GspH family protein [Candidatus Omnitrophota bacterium]
MFIKECKRGFTVMEVMTVVIILAILASLSLPTFIKTIEVSKGRMAKSYLKLIYAAEKVYRNEYDCYYPQPPGTITDLALINQNLGLDLKPSDDFDYVLTTSKCNVFKVEAKRKKGRYTSWVISINQNEDITEENKP